MVVIALVLLVVLLIVPIVGKARKKAEMVHEVSAARQLVIAMTKYMDENNGKILPGYKNDPAFDERGNELGNPMNARYPWRLVPYLETDKFGVLLVGNANGLRKRQTDYSGFVYEVSVFPSLGMNVFHVGGDYSGNSGRGLRPIPGHFDRFGRFCVTRDGNPRAGNLIAFASARHGLGGNFHKGYFKVEAPN
ncbi:MAG: hypothetical protein AAF492_28010, partial [Verrucomicrobiota bacterium]